MQRALGITRSSLAKITGLCALAAVPMVIGAACPPSVTVTLTGCPDEDVPAGSSFTVTAAAADGDGNDVTANATFTYEVTQGPQTITLTGQGNTRTVNIPADATQGATVLEVSADVPDVGTGSAECRFTIGEPAPCETAADCDDDDECTTDECGDDGCTNEAVDCDDSLDCTDDSCDSATGCVNEDNCPDGQFCNADLNACAECAEDADCDDSDACTDDTCGADGTCSSTPTDCDDGLDCTDDSCAAATGCVNASNCPETTPICTAEGCVECETNADCDTAAGETCVEGVCEGGTCETDEDCSDGMFCNGEETCVDGACEPGEDPCADFTCGDEDPICLEGDAAAVCECPPGAPLLFTLGTDNLLGTSDDDEFSAALEFNPGSGTQVATLQTGDAAEGLAGLDTMNATFSNNTGAGTTVVPTNLGGIEIFNISDFGDDDTTLNGLNVTGVEEINSVNSTNTVFVNNLVAPAALGLENTGEGIEAEFEAGATLGPDSELIVNLNGSNEGSYIEVETATNGFESVTINSLTTNNIIEEIEQVASTTLAAANFFGDMHVELRNTDPSVVAFDGSGMTGGGFTLGEGNGSATDPYDDFHFGTNSDVNTIIGSPGPDAVIFGATFDSNDASGSGETIDLGDGTDLFQASLGSTVGGVLPVHNTEELVLNSTAGGGAQVNLTGVTGIMNVFVSEDGASHGLTLLNIGATSGAFPALNYRGDGEQAAQIFDNVTYQAAGATGGGDTLTVNVTNRGEALNASGTANEYSFATLMAPAMENVVMTVADGPLLIIGGITASTLANATFTASSNLNVGDLSTNGSDTLLSITASAVTGNFTVSSDDMGSGSSITTGVGNDTVTIGDSGSDSSVVTLGDGNDIYTSDDADSQDVINSGAGNDVVTAGGGNNVVTTGSGPDDTVYNQTMAGNRSDVSDFTTGTGGDRMVFDEGDLGLATGSIYVGAVGGVGAEDVLIITGSTYVDDAAAAAAVAGVSANANPGVIVYFNTTDSTTHIVRVSNLDTGAGDAYIGTLSNITTAASHDTLTSANAATQP
jgi:hypothetical protein